MFTTLIRTRNRTRGLMDDFNILEETISRSAELLIEMYWVTPNNILNTRGVSTRDEIATFLLSVQHLFRAENNTIVRRYQNIYDEIEKIRVGLIEEEMPF